jgi:serine/threonine protein kinase
MDADSWRQAKSVLEAALLCPPDEREALVAARCVDASLRREVLACLHENDESFLESALTISQTFEHAASGDDVEAPPDIHPGERIGRYKVERRLGAGGMGTVFLCTDTELRRPVALKCLIASASAVDVRARLRHEASAAAQINHPNIAAVHDVVEHDGRPFLVMEYVEGEDLAHALKRERPSLDRILAIGRQLASALTAAHAKHIIHRDLKPANIQLMPDGSVKILDFGVAQAIWAADTDPDASTTVGAPVSTLSTLRTERGTIRHPGTPAYMSPEQMFGKPLDERSDIYSLGVILYEMATGHRPYSTDDPLDVVLALSHKLLRPNGAGTHLPEAVNDVIGKMLTVDLDQRYQSAAEVEAAITALIAPDQAAVLPADKPRSGLWRAAKIATIVVAVPLCIGVLGVIQTEAFNFTLGRPAPFNAEPRMAWFENGLRSLILPLAYQLGIAAVIAVFRFGRRILRLSDGIDHLLTTGAARTRKLSSRIGLDDPAVMAQALAAVGFVLLVVVVWWFYPIVRASMNLIDTNSAGIYAGLRIRKGWSGLEAFDFVLTALIFFLGTAAFRISRLRAFERTRRGTAPFAFLIVMLATAVIGLLAPYRIHWRNKFDRAVVSNQRCYVLGEHDDDWLVYCPEGSEPHNRVVQRTDPDVYKVGISESVFSRSEPLR